MDRGKLKIIQPDIARVGGLTEMRRFAALAEARGVRIIPHCWSTDILVAATMHFLVTQPQSSIQELNVTTSTAKIERINLRLKQHAKLLIERAATFEGKTVSSFILSSALASAEKTLLERESILLNERDAQRFLDALAKPIEFNEKLTAALAEHDRRVGMK